MWQASKSRAAQDNLAKLEKLSAPFEEQLEEAAKFVGVNLESISQYGSKASEGRKQSGAAIHYGREEWLLKWLLKRLQADVEPRYASLSYIEALL